MVKKNNSSGSNFTGSQKPQPPTPPTKPPGKPYPVPNTPGINLQELFKKYNIPWPEDNRPPFPEKPRPGGTQKPKNTVDLMLSYLNGSPSERQQAMEQLYKIPGGISRMMNEADQLARRERIGAPIGYDFSQLGPVKSSQPTRPTWNGDPANMMVSSGAVGGIPGMISGASRPNPNRPTPYPPGFRPGIDDFGGFKAQSASANPLDRLDQITQARDIFGNEIKTADMLGSGGVKLQQNQRAEKGKKDFGGLQFRNIGGQARVVGSNQSRDAQDPEPAMAMGQQQPQSSEGRYNRRHRHWGIMDGNGMK